MCVFKREAVAAAPTEKPLKFYPADDVKKPLVPLQLSKVAAQQGSYLADCFNRMEECTKNPEGPLCLRKYGRHRLRPFRAVGFMNQRLEIPNDVDPQEPQSRPTFQEEEVYSSLKRAKRVHKNA
ncbi:hypothetical protein L1987_19152 [Smallanthus sonchifolius]|uniref:Uncharacterized protein n=1 Tax=Smallanthus sonchifolius TaxID=185202 RepID=A0ACB9J2Q5_9ASTR|nr:hypothetical protein L1987_19152 [Smallanthus sonchifolius]